MAYVDGHVLAVPRDNKEAYRAMAAAAGPIFREHGALAMIECWGDDVPEGELATFPRAVELQEGEAVVFSWILWPSREARDEGNAKVMADPRLKMEGESPFDHKRMIFGGFEVLLEA
jgi:uncharacterized protein YbaA (DUF1428 family)